MTYECQNYILSELFFVPLEQQPKSCPVETVTACPLQIRAHHHIAVYIDSNEYFVAGKHVMSFNSVPLTIPNYSNGTVAEFDKKKITLLLTFQFKRETTN